MTGGERKPSLNLSNFGYLSLLSGSPKIKQVDSIWVIIGFCAGLQADFSSGENRNDLTT